MNATTLLRNTSLVLLAVLSTHSLQAQCIGDIQIPVIIPPANITVTNDPGVCGAKVYFTAPVGTDNCAVLTDQVLGQLSGSVFPIGTTTQMYVATDVSGNSSTATFTITVIDTELPVITCPSNVYSCHSLVNGIEPVYLSDNCFVSEITYTLSGATNDNGYNDASGTTFNEGTTTVTYIVTDLNANVNSASFLVVIGQADTSSATASICEGEGILLGGSIRTTAGVYFDTYATGYGCDSIVSTTLTLNAVPNVLLNMFNNNQVCTETASVALPEGSPAGGIYYGKGVANGHFEPLLAGEGVHYVHYAVENANGCRNSDSTMITVSNCTTGIAENILASLTVYPNPSNGDIHIDLGNTYALVEISIVEPSGKIVKTGVENNTDKVSADISELAPGLYFMLIKTDNQTAMVKVTRN